MEEHDCIVNGVRKIVVKPVIGLCYFGGLFSAGGSGLGFVSVLKSFVAV